MPPSTLLVQVLLPFLWEQIVLQNYLLILRLKLDHLYCLLLLTSNSYILLHSTIHVWSKNVIFVFHHP